MPSNLHVGIYVSNTYYYMTIYTALYTSKFHDKKLRPHTFIGQEALSSMRASRQNLRPSAILLPVKDNFNKTLYILELSTETTIVMQWNVSNLDTLGKLIKEVPWLEYMHIG